jgi:DNA polymerase I-like protein with 3'-5' exonuclease and polymerase domains
MNTTPSTKAGMKLFMDGTLALSRVEAAGIRIDVGYLDATLADIKRQIAENRKAMESDPVMREWKRMYGRKMKDGPAQLGAVLNAMGYHSATKTEKEGREQWNEAALTRLDIPFAKLYLATKKLNNTVRTFLGGIRREVDQDGYLHPFYKLASGGAFDDEKGGAQSYRSSSSDPNGTNWPKRNEIMAKLVRQAIIPRKGRRVGERDYSGIEVKMACLYTKDPQLIREFTVKGADPHGDTACQLFFLKPDEVEKKGTRDAAKNMFVFPQFYGSVYFQCAPPIWEAMERRNFTVKGTTLTIREHLARKGITRLGDCSHDTRHPDHHDKSTFVNRVREVEKDFWERRFKVYTEWKKKWWAEYQKRGWFALKSGFVCQGHYRRNQVLNYAIQGTAFHCLLWSLTETVKELAKRKMKSLVIGQIHDSMLADVPENEVQDYLGLTHEIMSERLPRHWDWITVPVETEVDLSEVNGNWYEMTPWVKNDQGVWGATS